MSKLMRKRVFSQLNEKEKLEGFHQEFSFPSRGNENSPSKCPPSLKIKKG